MSNSAQKLAARYQLSKKPKIEGAPVGWAKRAVELRGLQTPTIGNYFGHTNSEQSFGNSLVLQAMSGGPTAHEISLDGTWAFPEAIIVPKLEGIFKCRLVSHMHSAGGVSRRLYNGDNISYDIESRPEGGYGRISMSTTDVGNISVLQSLKNILFLVDDPKQGYIYALGNGMGGYTLIRVGQAGESFEPGNYSDKVLEGYRHVVQDLSTSTPCGRLVILGGPPGTGKTFILRSLLKDVYNAAFVVVPSHLTQDLGSPDLLPALLRCRDDGLTGPIILILEDADQVLVERKSGDLKGISALLNLGDGLLGSSLDIRIIATTNADSLELDAATMRPGRLCRYIEIGLLTPDHANQVFERLVNKPGSFKKEVSLAEVYQEARKFGWLPSKKEVPVRAPVFEKVQETPA